MTDFTDWKDAHDHAVIRARESQHDVAIRKVRWYGKTRYVVTLASVNDSDYALAEIVKPTDPISRTGEL